MTMGLLPQQLRFYESIRDFAAGSIAADATTWEIEKGFPRDIVRRAAAHGYLGGLLPTSVGGLGWDVTSYGLFTEAIAHDSVSLSGLFNVHTMVAQTILKWGSSSQRQRWLPALASGERVAAIAFTEPQAGSDLNGIQTRIEQHGASLRLSGTKIWITCGAIADLILVFGRIDDQPAAVLLEAGSPGLGVKPLRDMLGFRAAHLAQIEIKDCEVPAENLVGRPGSALHYLAPYALDFGRVSIAWACVGMLRACLEACSEHAMTRRATGQLLLEKGMIQTLLTDMGVDFDAAWLMAMRASCARDAGEVEATDAIMAAKYHASRAAVKHSANAVQIMGALGCDERGKVARHFRDARTMEIIEGSSQIIQQQLSRSYAIRGARGQARHAREEAGAACAAGE
ncbi:acyl-CoA dehydrogenase family protein [Bradyrhizobium ontarionense]|uniref:Acyl-CoA dehydrogenase family protein n=1 Tax=Bradyrhizobium ontarionense TaxID=2898149 RepID=A0ABY3RAW8_9BRAD|nr:acyl-CoA dehydrogenase family protein [Bradyrhizobium sp. A19]UFZ04094.1 acyl-CoA dehydrogenase family protein [Bradyrhizobium sp. A19]